MRAARLYSPFNFKIENIEPRNIENDEILLKVKSIGICRSDCHYYHYGRIGDIKIDEPIILGHEFSGEILRCGDSVSDFQIGDRVAIEPAVSCAKCEFCLKGHPNLCPNVKFCGTPPFNGALSDFFISKSEQLFHLPDKISYDEGALLEPLGIAIHSLNLAKPKIDDNIAILGCGPIGLLILKLLKIHPVNEIICIDDIEYRSEFSKKFGAHLSLTANTNSLEYNSFINNTSDKFDIIFEATGNNDVFNIIPRLLKPGGLLIIIGIFHDNLISLNSSILRRKGITIKFVRRMKNTYPTAINLVSKNIIKVKDLVSHKFGLDEVKKAFSIVDSYKNNVMKAIINP